MLTIKEIKEGIKKLNLFNFFELPEGKNFLIYNKKFDIIVSAHTDTVDERVLELKNGKISGMLDNLLGVLTTFLLPDEFGKIFTDGEEEGGIGAQSFSQFLKAAHIHPKLIVAIDVTDNFKEIISIENVANDSQLKEIIKDIVKKDKEIKVIWNSVFDEAEIYREYFPAFSICIPVIGDYHSTNAKISVERFIRAFEKIKELLFFFKETL